MAINVSNNSGSSSNIIINNGVGEYIQVSNNGASSEIVINNGNGNYLKISNDNSSSNIVLNNSNNNKLNVENSNTKSFVSVDNSSNNDLAINNLESTAEYYILLLIPIAFIYLFLTNRYKKPIISEVLNVKDEFTLRKEELEFIISTKINSINVKSRISDLITTMENQYYKNLKIINNLNFKQDAVIDLKSKNKVIILKLNELIDKIQLDDSKENVIENEVQDILRYIDLVDKAKRAI